MNWYTHQELRKGTVTWTTLQQNFSITFSIEHENNNIDAALKWIRGVIFIKELEVQLSTEEKQRNKQTLKDLLACYHVQGESLNEDDLRNIQIKKVEGERDVEGPPIESKVISMSIKVNKFNIRTTEQPKMASIGDYWDEKTVESIIELLCEYNDLFPTTFTEMKGIAG
jgi:copper chaperone CopZ